MVRVLFLLAFLLGLPAWGQELEAIPLRHRTVDQVLPVLQPLVEAGGTLTGANNQLFLRTSPRNRQEIRQALAALDTPLKRLVIRVSQRREGEESSHGAAVSGGMVVGTRRQVAGNAQVWDTRNARSDRGALAVQTVDGGRAFIQVGRSVPVPLRQMAVGPGGAVVAESMVYRDIGQGFYAQPRVNGDRVTLEISQQADTPGRYGPGSSNIQRLSTTVSGRLGEWMELGGVGQRGSSQAGTLSTGEVRETAGIWLMVEELP